MLLRRCHSRSVSIYVPLTVSITLESLMPSNEINRTANDLHSCPSMKHRRLPGRSKESEIFRTARDLIGIFLTISSFLYLDHHYYSTVLRNAIVCSCCFSNESNWIKSSQIEYSAIERIYDVQSITINITLKHVHTSYNYNYKYI
jgi:hypothetical protein